MKLNKSFIFALGLSAISFSKVASAETPLTSVRVEPGVAAPVSEPQTQRYGAGAALALKPELGVLPYLSLGPSLQLLSLSSSVAGSDASSALGVGGFVRLKRPHDASNSGTGLSAVSPWVDSDLRWVVTNGSSRVGWSVGVGASVPTSRDRSLWVGPFVRHDSVEENGTGLGRTLVAGISLELGVTKRHEPAPAPMPPTPTPAPPPPAPVPPPMKKPTVVITRMSFKPVIQFAFDSDVLEEAQVASLENVVKAMSSNTSYSVEIHGHASSEGQVAYNDALALRRAESVRKFLVAHGVDKSRLTVVGHGSRNPVADNSTEEGRVLNRRVEFDVTFVLVTRHLRQN